MKIGDIVQVRFTKVVPVGSEIKMGIIVGPPVKMIHVGYTWEILIEGQVHVIMRDHILKVIEEERESVT